MTAFRRPATSTGDGTDPPIQVPRFGSTRWISEGNVGFFFFEILFREFYWTIVFRRFVKFRSFFGIEFFFFFNYQNKIVFTNFISQVDSR